MEHYEKWIELCTKAAVEPDSKKMLVLMKELDDLLEAEDREYLEVSMRTAEDHT